MPGLVEDLGGRVVVGGQHRDALAVGVQLGDVDDGQAADGLGRGAHAGSRTGSMVRSVCAAASRSSSATATRSRRRVGDGALASGAAGPSRDPSAARIDTRLVSVPKPEPGSATSFATSRSTPLRRSLSAAARASPSRRRTRPGPGRGCSGSRVGGAVAVETVGDPGDLGEEVRRGLEPQGQGVRRARAWSRPVSIGRKSATAAAMTSASKPARRVGAVGQRAAARRAGRPSTDPDDRGRRAAAATSTFAAMTVTRAPRSSAASAIATPIRPVERLPMKRTGSIASRVPPAVTTTCRPGQVGVAGRTDQGRARRRVGARGPGDRRRPRRPRPRSRRARPAGRPRPVRRRADRDPGSTTA